MLPPLWELQGKDTTWLQLTLRGVGVDIWGTPDDGSGLNARLETEYKASNSKSQEGLVAVRSA